MSSNKHDLLLGKLAIAKKIVTKEQLKHCLQVQEKTKSPLGCVLLEEKLIDEDGLHKLVRHQHKSLSLGDNRDRGEDLVFARLAMREKLVPPQNLRKAISEQEARQKQDQKISLGELLLHRKQLALRDFLKVYHELAQETLECPGCQKEFRLIFLAPGKKVRCKHCKTVFTSPTLAQEIAAYEKGSATSEVHADQEAFGGYELLEEIAEGGMGVVYRAQKKSSGQIVAIKVLRETHRSSDEAKERFAREAKTLAMLEHPNIVSILEVGIENEVPYFVMDFIEGQPLSELIESGPIQISHTVEILIKICVGLQYAHEQNVIHRDIKPSNIILTEDEPKITDFGLAKCVDSITVVTKSGSTLGTPSFMSPEQAKGQMGRVGPRSDIYSLGVVFYQMLTRRNPFQGESTVEIYQNILTVEPPPPSQFNPMVSLDIDSICMKCLRKDIFQRYKTAAELAQDLREVKFGTTGFWKKVRRRIFRR